MKLKYSQNTQAIKMSGVPKARVETICHGISNTNEKKWVFRVDLKTDKVGAVLMREGRPFQSFGPTTEKARSPLVFSLVLGTCSRSELVDLSDLDKV